MLLRCRYPPPFVDPTDGAKSSWHPESTWESPGFMCATRLARSLQSPCPLRISAWPASIAAASNCTGRMIATIPPLSPASITCDPHIRAQGSMRPLMDSQMALWPACGHPEIHLLRRDRVQSSGTALGRNADVLPLFAAGTSNPV